VNLDLRTLRVQGKRPTTRAFPEGQRIAQVMATSPMLQVRGRIQRTQRRPNTGQRSKVERLGDIDPRQADFAGRPRSKIPSRRRHPALRAHPRQHLEYQPLQILRPEDVMTLEPLRRVPGHPDGTSALLVGRALDLDARAVATLDCLALQNATPSEWVGSGIVERTSPAKKGPPSPAW
jgi:hypothetical protein